MTANRSGHRQCGDIAADRVPAATRHPLADSLVLALAMTSWSAVAGTPPACTLALDVVGTGFGVIPDASGSAGCGGGTAGSRSILFNVPPVPGFVATDLDVSMALTHTWGGDLVTRLVAPAGSPEHVLFGRIGATTATGCGDSSNFDGTYVFSDFANPPSGGLWQAVATATSATPIPQGSYFSTGSGGAGAVNPMPATSIRAAFAGAPLAAFAGTWTLRFDDLTSGDAGTISHAVLSLCLNPPPEEDIFADGFEAP